jgi:hypothetical protein
MGWLVAHFKVELPGDCLVVSLTIRQTPLHCIINSFEVEVHVPGDSLSSEAKVADDKYWTHVLHSLVVKVARDEDEVPPRVI